jgi:hypothetical protein
MIPRSDRTRGHPGRVPKVRIPKPCIERLPDGRGCPEYAYDGPRCEQHEAEAKKNGASGSGTTAAWAKARKIALERTGYRCERCGRTDEQARADGTHLEVHHLDGRGVGALHHDQAKLRVLCRTPCHTATMRATPRKTRRQRMLEQQAELRSRAQARQQRTA